MSDEKRKWKTEMERTLAFFDSVRCGPRFDSMSTFQASAVWRAVASCGWQIFPDQLTDKQFELAKKGVVPSFADVDGRVVPVEERDESRADEKTNEETSWKITKVDGDKTHLLMESPNPDVPHAQVRQFALAEVFDAQGNKIGTPTKGLWYRFRNGAKDAVWAVVVSANKGFPEVWGLEPVAFDGQRRLVVVR